MKRLLIAIALIASNVSAHELTPTYPEFRPSYVENVFVTTLKLWNRRDDVEYYEITVVDKNWQTIPFATIERIVKVPYLQHKNLDIYIRKNDLNKVELICTTSKLLKEDVQSTGVRSMICSRVK